MKITALEPHARHPDWWHVALDGHEALTLDGATVVAEGLMIGADLSAADLARLRATAEERRLLDAALRFLAPRPRSRAEVRRRLLRPRPNRPPADGELIERVLARLEEMQLLNDGEFASYWVEQRERFSPRAAYALSQELRQRGVDRETADAATDPTLDAARALAAARMRARTLPLADYAAFRAKLAGFLMRRGFSYGVTRDVVRQLWEELGGARAGAGDDDDAADDGAEW